MSGHRTNYRKCWQQCWLPTAACASLLARSMAAARWAGLRAQAGRGGAAIAFVGSAAFAGGASVACLPAA
eukprot:COSAG06_NODE_37752_length_431_cov_1.286145_1_plen_69_part_10